MKSYYFSLLLAGSLTGGAYNGMAPTDIYNIWTDGRVNVIKTNDNTDTFNVHNKDGEQTASYTMGKTTASDGTALVNFPSSGDSWAKVKSNDENYIQPQAAAAIIGASASYKEATGNKVQITQLTNAQGRHSGHPAKGGNVDVRYANKNGGKNETVLTSGSNFDKASSQLLADTFRKFGFNDPVYGIFTENTSSNGPALNNTHFPRNTFKPDGSRAFSHQHHMHLNRYNPSNLSRVSNPANFPYVTPAPMAPPIGVAIPWLPN